MEVLSLDIVMILKMHSLTQKTARMYIQLKTTDPRNLTQDRWYHLVVYKENGTDEDIEVNIQVSGVELRIEDRVNIFDYKTDYIGDNVNVNVIAELLPYPSGYIKDYIEIKTSVKPFELIVHLKGEGSKEKTDFA